MQAGKHSPIKKRSPLFEGLICSFIFFLMRPGDGLYLSKDVVAKTKEEGKYFFAVA